MDENDILKIGDVSDNGQVEIIDKDRLCYIVKSESRGAAGVRTISKELLQEYITFARNNPDANANEARYALCGKTRIDRFEYGYSSTLLCMAKMVLNGISNATTSHTVSVTNTFKSFKPFKPFQQIIYGAPGTGKSYKVKGIVGNDNSNYVRTTFHPDTDYSTFVGAYKPTMKKNLERLYDKKELIKILTGIKETGMGYPCQKFATKYWNSLKPLKGAEIKEILDACGFTENFFVEINKGIGVGEELDSKIRPEQITYAFVAQAFLKAYVEAWKRMAANPADPGRFYLVIEEINRGNCAQIFGDLFQLLDRNDNGFSTYGIVPDSDIQNYLNEVLPDGLPDAVNDEGDVVATGAEIQHGDIMILPSNLHILATMNTSDQSLFPIDSAFKRRWDWQYVPIQDEHKGWKITADGKEYDWWTFLEKINAIIGDLTSSEDKKLGYFFAKARDGKITAETFVSKVAFYLWNDVFKDYGFDSDIFRVDGNEITFPGFFQHPTAGSKVDESLVAAFIENIVGKLPQAVGGQTDDAPTDDVEA